MFQLDPGQIITQQNPLQIAANAVVTAVSHTKIIHLLLQDKNKISCRREAARCFVSFIEIKHFAKSLKVIQNDTLQ